MTSMKKSIYTFPEALRVCKQHTPEIKITIKNTKQAFSASLKFFRSIQLPRCNTFLGPSSPSSYTITRESLVAYPIRTTEEAFLYFWRIIQDLLRTFLIFFKSLNQQGERPGIGKHFSIPFPGVSACGKGEGKMWARWLAAPAFIFLVLATHFLLHLLLSLENQPWIMHEVGTCWYRRSQ